MWINKKHYELLMSELEYFRGQYEAERRRADRLQDTFLLQHGVEPSSDTVREELSVVREKQLSLSKKVEDELAELMLESVPDEAEAPSSDDDKRAATLALLGAR